jgi:hypothetical protein
LRACLHDLALPSATRDDLGLSSISTPTLRVHGTENSDVHP